VENQGLYLLEHLTTNLPRKSTRKRSDTKTRAKVLALLRQGKTIADVAKAKSIPPNTVEVLEAKALASEELNANKSQRLRRSHKAGTKDKVMALRGKGKPNRATGLWNRQGYHRRQSPDGGKRESKPLQ
jgi:hypothetical protein